MITKKGSNHMSNYNHIQLSINLYKGVEMNVPTNEFILACIGILILTLAWKFFANGLRDILRSIKDFRKK